MQTLLYIIWFLIPAGFFVLGMWSLLEKIGGSVKKQVPADFFRPCIFSLVCALIAVAIDKYALQSILDTFFLGLVSIGFLQIILLPIVLTVGALILGPSKSILVSKGSGKPAAPKKKAKR